MITKIVMPQMGLTMEEGTVLQWFKHEGERVAKGEPLFEVNTDKVSTEVESPAEGILLKILVGAGETVPVQQTVALIGEKNDVIDEAGIPKADQATGAVPGQSPVSAPVAVKAQADGAREGRIRISPRARRWAEAKGIDPSELTGTGPNGRIKEADVLRFVATKTRPVPQPVGVDSPVREVSTPTTANEDILQAIPFTGMRRIIADRLTASKAQSPHFYLWQDVEMTRAGALRAEAKQGGAKITVTDLVVKAVARALKDFPVLNSKLQGDRLLYLRSVNVGVAVGLDDGLIVPVIKHADRKSLTEISSEIKELAEKARNNRILSDELEGGTFTVSNLGMYGIDGFMAIINPPQVGILAVGAIRELPAVEDGRVTVKPIMTLTLSVDHRIVDGKEAARFLIRVKDYLENPLSMLI